MTAANGVDGRMIHVVFTGCPVHCCKARAINCWVDCTFLLFVDSEVCVTMHAILADVGCNVHPCSAEGNTHVEQHLSLLALKSMPTEVGTMFRQQQHLDCWK